MKLLVLKWNRIRSFTSIMTLFSSTRITLIQKLFLYVVRLFRNSLKVVNVNLYFLRLWGRQGKRYLSFRWGFLPCPIKMWFSKSRKRRWMWKLRQWWIVLFSFRNKRKNYCLLVVFQMWRGSSATLSWNKLQAICLVLDLKKCFLQMLPGVRITKVQVWWLKKPQIQRSKHCCNVCSCVSKNHDYFLCLWVHNDELSRKGFIDGFIWWLWWFWSDLRNLNVVVELLALRFFEERFHVLTLKMAQLLSDRFELLLFFLVGLWTTCQIEFWSSVVWLFDETARESLAL